MLEDLHHELLNDGYKGIGTLGEGPDSEREGRKQYELFNCAVLEVEEGARLLYDITAVGLLQTPHTLLGARI